MFKPNPGNPGCSSLQSSNKEDMGEVVPLGEFKISIIDLASNSTSTQLRFLLIQSKRPSRRAHNSAIKLVATPMFLANPTT